MYINWENTERKEQIPNHNLKNSTINIKSIHSSKRVTCPVVHENLKNQEIGGKRDGEWKKLLPIFTNNKD